MLPQGEPRGGSPGVTPFSVLHSVPIHSVPFSAACTKDRLARAGRLGKRDQIRRGIPPDFLTNRFPVTNRPRINTESAQSQHRISPESTQNRSRIGQISPRTVGENPGCPQDSPPGSPPPRIRGYQAILLAVTLASLYVDNRAEKRSSLEVIVFPSDNV